MNTILPIPSAPLACEPAANHPYAILPVDKQPVAESTSLSNGILLGAGTLALASLAGCKLNPFAKANEDDAPPALPPPPAATIARLTLKDASGGVLSSGSLTGSPGLTFILDGGAGATNRAVDPGPGTTARAYDFAVSGTAGVGTVGITINPAPTDVSTALNARLVTTRSTVAAMAFPPSWDELMSYAGTTQAQIVERMLGRMDGLPREAYPEWIDTQLLSSTQYNALSAEARDAYEKRKYPLRQEFKAWFFRQMVTSADSLSERLLLFWHNHFTTSASSVEDPELIARQHRLYRQNVGGNLRTFLKAMTRDPAMCEYLDSALNKKGKPNENFARELIELFTLGERSTYASYAEADIPMVALCFTGYGVDANENFQFNPSNHDFTTDRTLWGVARATGDANDGDWLIDQILAKVDGSGHSYCARYIVTKLWKEFIGDPATSAATIQAIADQFSGAFSWDLKSLYRALFTSAEFVDPLRRATRIKSPVELYVTYFRALGITPTKWDETLWTCYTLDQDLLDPPNVFGWPGGTNWITVKTLVDRREYMSWMGWTYRDQVPERLNNVLDILLLAGDPIGGSPSGTSAADRSRQYITDSAFNLR